MIAYNEVLLYLAEKQSEKKSLKKFVDFGSRERMQTEYFPNEFLMNRSLCSDGNFLNYHEEKRSDVEDWQLDQEKVKIISTK